MIRILLWGVTALLLFSGLTLLISSVAPLIQDFAQLRTTPADLTPLLFRLLGALALLGATRWTVQAALRR